MTAASPDTGTTDFLGVVAKGRESSSQRRSDRRPQSQAEAMAGGYGEIELAGRSRGSDSDARTDCRAFRGRVTIAAKGLAGQRADDAGSRDVPGVVLDVRFSFPRVARGS